jgi:uncharacterized protein (DUF2249 family)
MQLLKQPRPVMIINANTKIGAIIKHHPDALEAIVSISPKFVKLRNPILRKAIAGRASIAVASKLSGCKVDDFFNKLQLLGFEIDTETAQVNEENVKTDIPDFLKTIDPENMIELDVRPVIETGKDPFDMIMQQIKTIKEGQVLKIINSFEPTPLLHLLGRQGFESFSEVINEELVYAYFYKKSAVSLVEKENDADTQGWDEVAAHFTGKTETIDVRALEMPLPMHTILEALDKLSVEKALLVFHKRIPVFLLPELEERNLSYRIKEISETEVQLLIYRD